MKPNPNVSPLGKLNLIFRFSYTFVFTLAAVCGVLYAHMNYDVPLHIMILIPSAVMFLALFVNFSNDYFDHVSGVDDLRFNKNKEHMLDGITDSAMMRKLYWDGNPVNNGLVSKEQAKLIMAGLLAAAVLISIPIISYGGWKAAALGLAGILIAFFYTAPPVNLGARGLGEVSVAASFFLMVFGSFLVASYYERSAEIFVFSILIGLMTGHMRIVDSMSGQEAHAAAGEKSISVLAGLDGMGRIIKKMIVISYVIVSFIVLFDLTYIVLFLTLPLAAAAWKICSRKEILWEVKTAPLMFLTAIMTEILFIAAQIMQMYFEYPLL